jgi:hypothetical protein
MDTMSIGFLIAAMSRITSRQYRLKQCMIMMALMSLQHQKDRIQRLIMNRESRNMQHFLLIDMRSYPSGVRHPLEYDFMITIETGNDEEFRSIFSVSRPVFSALLNELASHLRDGRSRNRRQNISAELKRGISLFCMGHGGSGKHFSSASDLKKCTALRYLYQVPGLCVCRRRRVASAAG